MAETISKWPFVVFARPEGEPLLPRVLVAGVGGAGCSLVGHMLDSQSGRIEFAALDTDLMSLSGLEIEHKILLGKEASGAIGTGCDVEKARAAAEEVQQEWEKTVKGFEMIFIVAGMGGGTGSGAAPYLAKIAKDAGVLTVAVVSSPFEYEGKHKALNSKMGIAQLREWADGVIVVPNDKLFSLSDRLTYSEALSLRDQVLSGVISGITDLFFLPARMAIDFGSVKAIIQDGGTMAVATARASGERKVEQIADSILNSSLLEHPPLQKAQALLIAATLAYNVTAFEAREVKTQIAKAVSPRAKIICGTRLDQSSDDSICVTIIATHFDAPAGPELSVTELPRVFTVEEINQADLSHPIFTPTIDRMRQEVQPGRLGPTKTDSES